MSLKGYLSIIWWSSCFEGNSSSRISAWRKASIACNSSVSISSSKTDITLLCLRPFLKECLNLEDALIATFFKDPSLVFFSSSKYSISRPVFCRNYKNKKNLLTKVWTRCIQFTLFFCVKKVYMFSFSSASYIKIMIKFKAWNFIF